MSPEEVEAKAREVLEGADDGADGGDVSSGVDPVVVPPARRGASPVFSPRHREAVAEATAGRAPARTHDGVAEATGVAVGRPGGGPKGGPKSSNVPGRSRAGSSTRTDRKRPSSAATGSPRSTTSSRTTPSTDRRSSSGAAARTSNRPPPRPMPAWLDRFGGNEPGGRWVMMSFAMVLMASVVINFVHIVPPPAGSVTLRDGSDSVQIADASVIAKDGAVQIVAGGDDRIDVPVDGKVTHGGLKVDEKGEVGDGKSALEVKVGDGDVAISKNTEMFTIWHFGFGPGLYFLLPPIVILGLFILTARPWDRRRSWNIALGCLVFITFITQSISIYIVPIGALAWGCWQARKDALAEVDGDPRVLREVERERRLAGREALRAARGRPGRRRDAD